MTTQVTVRACCEPSTTEVEVIIKSKDGTPLEAKIILQDGEETCQYIYEDKVIYVAERKKKQN